MTGPGQRTPGVGPPGGGRGDTVLGCGGRCGPLRPRPARPVQSAPPAAPPTRPALTRPVSPQELLLFLQNLPTAHWGDGDVSLLLAEAYRLKFAFADAPSHYKK